MPQAPLPNAEIEPAEAGQAPVPASQAFALAKIRELRDRLAKDESVSAAIQGFYDHVEQAPTGNFVAHPEFPQRRRSTPAS